MKEKVEQALETIRPALQADGVTVYEKTNYRH